jgi:hypothetical protein
MSIVFSIEITKLLILKFSWFWHEPMGFMLPLLYLDRYLYAKIAWERKMALIVC